METTGHLIEGWTCTLFAIFLFFLLPEPGWVEKQIKQCMQKQCRHISPLITSVSSCTSSIVGHGSAICARGIFSQDLPFPPQRLKFGLPRFCWCPSCQVQLTEQLLHSGPKSRHSRFISTWLSAQRRRRACRRYQLYKSFTNNCNPLIWLRRRMATCVYFFKVIIQLKTPETPNNPLVLPGTRVRHSGFGFDKRAEERRAVPNSVIL